MINRALIFAWNRANRRARIAYENEPIACADGCPKCDQEPGTSRYCLACKDVRRLRKIRKDGAA